MSITVKVGGTAQTLNQWVKKAAVDSSVRADLPVEVTEKGKALEWENREPRQGQRDAAQGIRYLAQAGTRTAGSSYDQLHRRSR